MRRGVCLALSVVLLSRSIGAQDAVLDRITGSALQSPGSWEFVAQLTDGIGARVTGTPQLPTAQELIATTLRSSGLDRVAFEEWPLASRWRRGQVSASMVSPVQRPLAAGTWAWSPGTRGTVTAHVLDLGVVNAVPAVLSPDVRGAAVIIDPAGNRSDTAFVVRTLAARQLAQAGAAAVLVPSDKPGRMLSTSSCGNYPGGALPMLSVGKEDTALIRRLLRADPVSVSLLTTDAFDQGPFMEPNAVADLTGREVPDEVMLAPLATLGANDVLDEGSFDTDRAYFAALGVPTLDLSVEPSDYDIHHHAVTDTLDKVDRRQLALNAGVIAAAAWLLANTDEPLQHLLVAASERLMDTLGFTSAFRLLKAQR